MEEKTLPAETTEVERRILVKVREVLKHQFGAVIIEIHNGKVAAIEVRDREKIS